MTMQLNGHRPALVPVILIEPDQSGALLDELDTALTDLGAALADRDVAASLFDEADRTARMASERVQLLKLAIKARLAGDAR